MRKAMLIMIPIALVLVVGFSSQFCFAISETFPLAPMQTIIRNVELQSGDQLIGSFSISSLDVWQNGLGEDQSYTVSVTILDPNGQTVLSYSPTTGNSFDYTAFYSGVYTIQFGCGFEYLPPSGIPNPDVTLNYIVVSGTPSTPVPQQQQTNQNQAPQTQQPNISTNALINPRIIIVIAAAVIISVGVAVIGVLTAVGKLRLGALTAKNP